jgi:protein-disulfide isomerase
MHDSSADPVSQPVIFPVSAKVRWVARPLRVAVLMLVVTVLGLLGCAPGLGRGSHASRAAGASGAVAPVMIAPGDLGPVPIEPESPHWGDDTAPVTVVEFSDLECPFCARVQPALDELMGRYGPHQLRLVFRHDPLEFHSHARAAALAAEAVRELGGDDRFFRYIGLLFHDQSHLEPADLRRAAVSLGVDAASFDLLSRSPAVAAHVDGDIALAGSVGANGTPHFLVNGVQVSGAVPVDDFIAVVERELAAARALTAAGTAPADVYVARTKENFKAEPPRQARQEEAPDERTFNVPVGTSPRLGPDDALVTIIEFSDFQCPFCKRIEPTLRAVRARYGDDVRIVWKHLPLPFHPLARPAATLTIEAYKALGAAGFWKAVDLVFEASPELGRPALAEIATDLGLDARKVQAAIDQDADAATFFEDEGTSVDFEARGTPHFFINGQRLVGAQPLESFTAVIDARLDEARRLVASGVPRGRVFDELMRRAAGPPPPEKKSVPAPTAANPSRGPSGAPVVVQMFTDFECPYCRRSMKTIEELERRHPNQVAVVYRSLPLEFHPGARLAAAAALEAYAQRGAEAFWKMTKLIEADQDDPAPLTRDDLVAHAKALGLDVKRLSRALDDGRHDAAIDADVELATNLGIKGTPSFVINGYYVAGALPLAVFERAVQRALTDAAKAPGARAK